MVPLCTTRVLLDQGSPLRDGRHNLRSTASVPNNSQALPTVVIIMIPPGRVEDLAVEFLHSRKLRVARLRDSSNGGYEDRRRPQVLDAGLGVAQSDVPVALLVPGGRYTLDAEMHVFAKIELIHRRFHVYGKMRISSKSLVCTQ